MLLDIEGATCCKDNKFILERFFVDEARNDVEVLGDSWNVEDRNALERCLLHRLFVAHDDTVERREQIIGNAAARFTSLGQFGARWGGSEPLCDVCGGGGGG